MKFFIAFIALIVAVNAYSDESAWIEFKNKYSKGYQLVEEKFRFQVFQKKLRKIEAHNERYERGEVGYFLKVTNFSDWTEDEFNSFLNHQASSRLNYDDYDLGTFEHDPTVAIPKSFDWRDRNAVLPVKNQLECGSCWTFSTTGALEGQLAIHKNQSISLSEQELIDCSSGFGINNGCAGGNQVPAFKYVKQYGIGSDDEYPYTAQDGNVCKKVNRVISTLSGVKRVARSEEALISAIATVGPIAVSVAVGGWSEYGGGIFDDTDCGDYINHAVLAVGYTEDYFIIKNSWGTDWGDWGYIKVIRGSNICSINNDNSFPVL